VQSIVQLFTSKANGKAETESKTCKDIVSVFEALKQRVTVSV